MDNINQPTQAPLENHETLKVSTSSDPNHSPKMLLIGLGAFLIIIIGGGIGYFLGVDNSEQTTPANTTPIVKVSPTPTPDPTANWKTYTNTKYGYEAKYPQSWYLYETKIAPATVGFWIEKTEGEASGVWVSVHENLSRLTPEEWWDKDIKKAANYQDLLNKTIREDRLVNGYSAFFVQTDKDWQSRPGTWIFLNKDEKIYEIFTNFTEGANYMIFDQILSTFKFTPASSTGEDQKQAYQKLTEFEHPTLHYKVHLPQNWLSRLSVIGDNDRFITISPDVLKSVGRDNRYGATISIFAENTNEADIDTKFSKEGLVQEIAVNKINTVVDEQKAIQYGWAYEGITAIDTIFIKNGIFYKIQFEYADEIAKKSYLDSYSNLLNSFKAS